VWSVTAIITVTATGTCTVVLFVLYLVYTWLLSRVKKGDNERGSTAHVSDNNTENSKEKGELKITGIN
jgi:Ca2+/Na+ antiporter